MNIAVVNYSRTAGFFVEIARATTMVLRSLGHTVFELPAPGTSGIHLEIIFGNGFKVYDIPLWPKRSDRKVVFFNMEMLPLTPGQFSEPWRVQSIAQIADLAPRVDGFLDTSPENIEAAKIHLAKLNLKSRFAHCPAGYHELYDHSRLSLPRTTEVLFFGALSARRVKLLDTIKLQASVMTSQSLFGQARDLAAAQAKINLNLHVTNHGCSLGLRVPMFFMSSGHFFVSETIKGWNPLVDGEHYRVWDQKDPDFFRKLLADGPLREKIGEQGREFLRSQYSYNRVLPRALGELGVL